LGSGEHVAMPVDVAHIPNDELADEVSSAGLTVRKQMTLEGKPPLSATKDRSKQQSR